MTRDINFKGDDEIEKKEETRKYDLAIRALLNAGFTDSEANVLVALFMFNVEF
jgi:hypothetical protein